MKEKLNKKQEEFKLDELPDEVNYSLKPDHLKRSIANQPNHRKCKKVKGLMSKKELEEYDKLIFPTDTMNLGC